MKRIAMTIFSALILTLILSSSHEVLAAPVCGRIFLTSDSPARTRHDFDVQFFVTSDQSMDLLLASSPHEAVLYKMSSMERLESLPALMLSPHPKLLPKLGAVADFTDRGELILMDLNTKKLSRWNVLDLKWNQITNFDLSDDGRVLAIQVGPKYEIFDTQERRLLASGHGLTVGTPRISNDGKEITLLIDQKLTVLAADTGKLLSQTDTDIYEIPGAIYSPDGRSVGGRQLNPSHSSIYDTTTGKKLGEVEGRISSFSPNAELMSVNFGTRTRLYSLRPQKLLAELKHLSMHWSSHFSEDGQRLFISLQDGTLQEYDLKSLLQGQSR